MTQYAITIIIGSIISGFFTQFGGDLYHTIKNTTINLSFQIHPPSFVYIIPPLAGIAGFSLLCYDIMDMRRKRNDQKAQSKERAKKLEDGEPDTEPFRIYPTIVYNKINQINPTLTIQNPQ